MTGRRRRLGQVVLAVTAVALVTAGLAGSATGAAKAPGTATPPKGSGINTPAALNDPRCTTTNNPYGRWSFVSVGTGPVCVRPFEDGEKNGGATTRGHGQDDHHRRRHPEPRADRDPEAAGWHAAEEQQHR